MTSSCATTPRSSNSDEDTLAPDDLTDFEDDEEVFGDEQVIYPKVFITPTTRQENPDLRDKDVADGIILLHKTLI